MRSISSNEIPCILLLALASLWVRIDTWLLPPFNPDEAQYAAHASYLAGTNQGPFATPIGPVHGNAVYSFLAGRFGVYELFPARVLATLCLFATAALVYALARRVMTTGFALLAGLIVVCLSGHFEGFAANREWFALPFVLGGIACFARALDGNRPEAKRWLFASGLLCGLAVLAKDQAAAFLLPAPIFVLGQLLPCGRGERVPHWRRLGALAAGMAAAAAAYVLPFALAGTWSEHWRYQVTFRSLYAGRFGGAATIGEHLIELYDQLYAILPFRRLFLVAYLGATGNLLAAFGSRVVHPLRGFLSLFLMAAVLGISAGGRFFPHYFLFLVPPVAVLVALMLLDLVRGAPPSEPGQALLVFSALLLDLIGVTTSFRADSGSALVGLALLAATLGIIAGLRRLAHLALSFTRIVGLAAAGLIALDLARLLFTTGLDPLATSQRGRDPIDLPALTEFLREGVTPEDCLFVWGWRPEIYASTRIPAATRFATAMEISRDVFGDLATPARPPEFDQRYLGELLADLEVRRPRYIVDAWLRSVHGSRYRLEFYPPLETYLAEHYRLVTTLDGCDVYQRLAPGEPPPPTPSRADRLQHALRQARGLVARLPHDVPALLLLGDLLAQEGQRDEARELYERIRTIYPDWTLARERLRSPSLSP